MQRLLATSFLMFATGCATTPARICDHDGVGLTAMSTPPDEAPRLLAEVRADLPAVVDERRDNVVWLTSARGDLYLCTYPRRPASTGTCGATVHHFARTASGYEGKTISISACH